MLYLEIPLSSPVLDVHFPDTHSVFSDFQDPVSATTTSSLMMEIQIGDLPPKIQIDDFSTEIQIGDLPPKIQIDDFSTEIQVGDCPPPK